MVAPQSFETRKGLPDSFLLEIVDVTCVMDNDSMNSLVKAHAPPLLVQISEMLLNHSGSRSVAAFATSKAPVRGVNAIRMN